MVSEFDDTKRSCRRRLAGHNERRRKGSNESMGKINPPQGTYSSINGSAVSWMCLVLSVCIFIAFIHPLVLLVV